MNFGHVESKQLNNWAKRNSKARCLSALLLFFFTTTETITLFSRFSLFSADSGFYLSVSLSVLEVQVSECID